MKMIFSLSSTASKEALVVNFQSKLRRKGGWERNLLTKIPGKKKERKKLTKESKKEVKLR